MFRLNLSDFRRLFSGEINLFFRFLWYLIIYQLSAQLMQCLCNDSFRIFDFWRHNTFIYVIFNEVFTANICQILFSVDATRFSQLQAVRISSFFPNNFQDPTYFFKAEMGTCLRTAILLRILSIVDPFVVFKVHVSLPLSLLIIFLVNVTDPVRIEFILA